MPAETCATCRFAHMIPFNTADAEGVYGYCRLWPPEFVSPDSSTLKPTAPDG